MRCLYCRPATLSNPRNELRLTPDEIEQLVRHLVDRHGLYKVRLTGGDPSSRPQLLEIIARIARIPGVRELAMTTNGLTLARHARDYVQAGLQRVNISLDTLNAQRFAHLTGIDGLARVLLGLEQAKAAGLSPIKLNTVVVKGSNEQDLPDLVRFAARQGVEARMIELMPMGPLSAHWHQRYVPEAAMRRVLDPYVSHWQALAQGHDAARRYRVTLDDGSRAIIGFITPMSCNFCAACNRIRVAADGTYYPCLMDQPRGSLLPAVRPVFDPQQLDAILAAGLADKRQEHPHDGFVTMTTIGG